MGRDREVADLRGLLERSRLVTVTGTGGVGKTRLALQTATELVGDYRDGVRMVDLAAISDPVLVPKAVASGVGIQEQPNRTIPEALIDQLGLRQLLLFLDNCEHLAQAVAELVTVLLRACPQLRVLATSRGALRVAGEVAWPLSPLATPPAELLDGPHDLTTFDAVRLFMERAKQALPRDDWSASELNRVADICRKLDGLPLAIELAAARAKVLGLGDILERLNDRFALLTRGEATALPRQRTLRATLDWSFALLSFAEQVLLRRLAVFTGGFELGAAEVVAGADPIELKAVLDLLSELADKSMVVVEAGAAGSARYRLLETVREYALQQLEYAGEEELFLTRHRDWCVRLVEDAEPHLYRSEQLKWLSRLELEQGNIRAALAYSANGADPSLHIGRLASALGWFWYQHEHFAEGRRWLKTAMSLAATSPPYARSAAFLWTGMMAYGEGDLGGATTWFEQSADSAQTAGDKHAWAFALNFLSMVLCDTGRYQESTAAAEHALTLARECEFTWGIAVALYRLAANAHFRSDFETDWRLLDESLLLFRQLGDRLWIAGCLHALADRAERRGDLEETVSLVREALRLSEEVGNRKMVSVSLENLALLAMRRGSDGEAVDLFRKALKLWREIGNQYQAAVTLAGLGAALGIGQNKSAEVRLFAASEALTKRVGGRLRPDYRAEIGYERAIAAAREALGKKAFDQQWAAGRSLTLDAAIDYALTCETSPRKDEQGSTGNADLSRREREVAVMLGRGLTNREIARELVISKQTVDRHVSNILSKLGFTRRSQVAAWVAEQRQEHRPSS